MFKHEWVASGFTLGALCASLTVANPAAAQAAQSPTAPTAQTTPATEPAAPAAPTAPAAVAEPAAPTEPAAVAEPAAAVAEPAAPETTVPAAASTEPTSVESAGSETAAADEAALAHALDQGQTEARDKQYLFLGGRYRAVVIPALVQGLFADGGKTLFAHTPGVEFGIRKNDFEYNLFAQLGMYSAEDVPFKGSTEDNEAWEILDFDYKILTLGTDFMWSSDEFAPGLSLTYGAGVGLGAVFGELKRNQAYPRDSGDEGNPDDYLRCEDQGVPDARFCGDSNERYNSRGYIEPTWADGGDSPLVFPWLAGQLGLRYKMHRNFVARVELGIMPTGAFAGVGAAYGL
ncbi:MAG: hypothetical protein RJA70_4290 [Pseudomonadota bacterium]|jgi:hypothetical protein